MALAIFAMRVLEIMFFVGLAGSAVVVLISFVEDGKDYGGMFLDAVEPMSRLIDTALIWT
jgi:hypothetical protein